MNKKLTMDDDSFERDLFRARAENMPRPALGPVGAVIARGEARRRARVVSFLPSALSRVSRTLAKTAGPIAMLHAAAGIFVFVAWGAGVHAERVRPDVTALDVQDMSLDEPTSPTDRERGTCGAAASFFGLTCESLPASMPLSCDAPTQSNSGLAASMPRVNAAAICEGPSFASCGKFVTCADDGP